MGTLDTAVEHGKQGRPAQPEPATPTVASAATPATPRMVDQARAQTFGQALAVLLTRHGYYDEQANMYLLPQFYERLRQQNGRGIRIAALRSYLRGAALPSEAKTRLLADALGVPRGLLLYVAGYLTPEDLAHYPGPQLTFAAVEADIAELVELPLSPETRTRIVHDLRVSARILGLLGSDDGEQADQEDRGGPTTLYVAAPDERETLIERLIELWSAPPPPPLTSAETAEVDS